MDETTLRQHMIMAEGKPPDSYRETISVSSTTAGDFSQRELHRGLDYKTFYGSGPFSYQRGRFEGREWDSDRNGLTIIHDPAAEFGRTEKRTVIVERVHSPFEAWKMSSLNAQKVGSIEYIDARAFTLRREEQIFLTKTETTDFDDFKTAGGYTFPSHWKKTDKDGREKVESRITSFESGQVSDASLAIPASRNLVEFPASIASINLPTTIFRFRSTTMHHRSGRLTHGFPTGMPYIVVHAMVGPRAVEFLLDSGSDAIVLDSEAVKGLGLATQGQLALVPEMRIGDLSMRGTVVRVGNVNWTLGNNTGDTHVVGYLGYDFLRSVGLTINYQDRRITAFPAGSYQPPVMTPDSDILPIRLAEHVPATSATINGASADQMVIDTAGSSLFLLFDYFRGRNPQAFTPEVALRLGISRGGSTLNAEALRLREVQIGRYHLRNYDAYATLSDVDYPDDCDGVIGPSFLQHFTVGFDYAGGKMYLVHNPGQ